MINIVGVSSWILSNLLSTAGHRKGEDKETYEVHYSIHLIDSASHLERHV